ncbi:MAG: adenylyltransferase/cytidyltransferase family protein [Rhabdochlamydiaceae bacterium]|nr:adenylyltransferase/cytidyltransferase family protein [Candidatus Amphrikana amoebophyrae]
MSDPHIFTHSKITPPQDVKKRIEAYRKAGKSIVTINGSFDLLHAGHLHIIFGAKAQGDILCVALNSDKSIKQYKSKDRPIIELENRLEMMAALEAVDLVTWFDEVEPQTILKKIHPDVHVNGAEYGSDCVEAECVKEMGAKLYLVQRIPALSTSAIIAKIQSVCV